MNLNHRLELEPVLYGNLPIKLLEMSIPPYCTSFELHWHTRFEMLVIQNGAIEITVGNEQFTASKGDIVLINPEEMHTGRTLDSSVDYLVIMFEFESFAHEKILKKILMPFQNGDASFVNIIKDSEIFIICEQIFDMIQRKTDGFELNLIGIMYYMLGILVNRHINVSYSNSIQKKEFADIIDYVSKNYCNNITTKTISDTFGYNEAYFCRRFKLVTGLTPLTYIKILRLEKAKSLLKHSDHSLIAIASMCGFPNPDYFGRCFKSHYKITPTKYRTQNS